MIVSSDVERQDGELIGPTIAKLPKSASTIPMEGDRVDEVDVGEDEVDQDGVGVGAAAGEQGAAVLAQALDHPARPAAALTGEGARVSGAGEGDRGALVADAAVVPHHRPGEDDVLADPVGPAADPGEAAVR